jgi:hypothetical protein
MIDNCISCQDEGLSIENKKVHNVVSSSHFLVANTKNSNLSNNFLSEG